MLDRQTGVWLSHSTPKFPTYRSKDFWPKSGNANAQTFMCVTYSYNDFKEIGMLISVILPSSFDRFFFYLPNGMTIQILLILIN